MASKNAWFNREHLDRLIKKRLSSYKYSNKRKITTTGKSKALLLLEKAAVHPSKKNCMYC